MDEDCRGRYTKSSDWHMYIQTTKNMKAIDFLIVSPTRSGDTMDSSSSSSASASAPSSASASAEISC